MVLRGIISMWMVWITFATITVVIKKLRGHNWDDLAWKHTWTRRWKTRLLAPWCGHGYTFSSTMCAFMCIFHLWNIHTAGYFNAHDCMIFIQLIRITKLDKWFETWYGLLSSSGPGIGPITSPLYFFLEGIKTVFSQSAGLIYKTSLYKWKIHLFLAELAKMTFAIVH